MLFLRHYSTFSDHVSVQIYPITTPRTATLPLDPATLDTVKTQLLRWASQFSYCLFLDNCESEVDRYGQYEVLVGIGKQGAAIQHFEEMEAVHNQWIMGGLPYELRHRFEPSLMREEGRPERPEVAFFVPETVISIRRGASELVIEGPENEVEKWIFSPPLPIIHPSSNIPPDFSSNFTQTEYLAAVDHIRDHIREGDFYELNLSQRFIAPYELEDPVNLFRRLTALSPVPFAAFFKFEEQYLLCASPERFLQLTDDRLLTQPIKGTAARGQTLAEDKALREQLYYSPKERGENVMIVDLCRNDLYRSCHTNSVAVPHLFEIQPYPTLFQMVSTIVGEKRADISVPEVLSHTFPAGSMTGAPKVMSMEMIDRYERINRGLYAGSVGYFAPSGDFDLNVVIRSLMYDDMEKQLSYHVGGAITYDSNPQAEYEETLLKAMAIRKLFEGEG